MGSGLRLHSKSTLQGGAILMFAGIHLALAPICNFWEFSYVLWVVKVLFSSSFLSIPFSHMDQIRIISTLIRSFTSFLSSKANPFSNVFAIFVIE